MGCLPNFTKDGYFIIKDLITDTASYPYAITNIDQSILIGLKSEEDTEIFIPKSFRVKGNIFDKADADKLYEINYIFSKTDKDGLYDNVLYQDQTNLQSLDKNIVEKINLSVC